LFLRLPFLSGRFPLPLGYKYGYNRITWELRPGSKELKELESQYRNLTRRFDELRLPRPLSVEANGNIDSVIRKVDLEVDKIDPRAGRAGVTRRHTSPDNTLSLILQGSHPDVKSAGTVNSPIVKLLTQRFSRFAESKSLDLDISADTLSRTLLIDEADALIGLSPIRRTPLNGEDTHVL
jgi:hypothetical protein